MALIARLQRLVTQEPPGLASTMLCLGVLAGVATACRIALNPLLGPGLFFLTYFPAVLVATLFLGWWAGLVELLLSAVMADYFFMAPRFAVSLDSHAVASILAFFLSCGLDVAAAGLLRATLRRLESANDLERRLNAELQHRMKNTLAIIQGMVHQTARRETNPKEFQRAINGRITALADAHDLLSDWRWEICELPLLAERAVAPFRMGRRISTSGPPCALAAECCVPLVLALHELATNAFKYGALSVPQGATELSWHTTEDEVVLRWVEKNGPVVTAPTRHGLGSRLLASQKGLEAVTLEYKPEGVQCFITVSKAKPESGRAHLAALREGAHHWFSSRTGGRHGMPHMGPENQSCMRAAPAGAAPSRLAPTSAEPPSPSP